MSFELPFMDSMLNLNYTVHFDKWYSLPPVNVGQG